MTFKDSFSRKFGKKFIKSIIFVKLWLFTIHMKYLTTLLLLCFLSTLQAQNLEKIKTLKQALQYAKGKEKVKTFNKLCWAYRASNINKALSYGKKSLALAKKIKFVQGEAEILSMMGVVKRNAGDYTEAFDLYSQALEIAEKHSLKIELAYAYNNLGEIYKFLGDYTQAIDYTQKTIHIFSELNDKKGIAYGYIRFGEIYQKQERYKKALEVFQKSLEIRKEIGEKDMIEASINRLGIIYEALKNYKEAKKYFKEGLKLSEETGDIKSTASNLNGLAHIYHREGKSEKASKLAKKALKIAQKNGNKPIIKSTSEILTEIYIKTKNYQEAYFYQNIVLQYKDSLISEDKRKAIQGLELRNALKQKDMEKAQLAREQALNKKIISRQAWAIGLIVVGLGLLISLALVLLRSNRQKQKTNQLLLDKSEEIKQQSEEIRQQSEILEKERQKSDELLLNILPYQVAQELKSLGTSKVKSYKIASILFTDFKGFTDLASKMSEDTLIEELNECFKGFDKIIKEHKIEKIKTIGDAYMCAGGLPEANESNPIDTVLAGLQMQEFMQERKKAKEKQGENYWACRLGINTGEVRAGVIGTSKFAYDVWGDPVNIASRMESGGEINKVNISYNTYQYIKDYFECEFRGEIEVKNGLILKMFFVNRLKPEYSTNESGTKPNERLYATLMNNQIKLA